MREWNLTAASPVNLRFAADARSSPFDNFDDQVWEIALGAEPDRPALSVQSALGARVGLARIDTLWDLPEQSVYATRHFTSPFVIRAFAPNYARLMAQLTPSIAITFELWVMASRAVGGRYTVVNQGGTPIDLQLSMIPQIAREAAKSSPKLAQLDNGLEVIALGRLPGLSGVLLLEDSQQSHLLQGSIPRLSTPLTLPPHGSISRRWVHAGYATVDESIAEGRRWLMDSDWEVAIAEIVRLAADWPTIETGDVARDAALAFGLNTVLRSLGGPSSYLPKPTILGARIPSKGYAPRGSAAYSTEWAGPTAATLWLGSPTLALIDGRLGKDSFTALLSTANDDGWIDWKPGFAGQHTGMLAMPLLASTAWAIYNMTMDKRFLEDSFPALRMFVGRWFGADMDSDGDGAPEWQSLIQAGQPEHAVFNRFRRWASNAEIQFAETPDLLALLICECESLLRIAQTIAIADVATIQAHMAQLGEALQAMWDPSAARFASRDRDSHQSYPTQSVFSGKGDQWLAESVPLATPSRLLIRVIGGQSSAPSITAHIEGIDRDGKPITETIPLANFIWYYGLGTAISENLYSEIHFAKVDGLSRVFQIEVVTPDLTREILTNSLPIWAGATHDQSALIIRRFIDTATWLKPFGLPSAIDPALGTDNPNSYIAMFWNCLILDGLLARGDYPEAYILLDRLLYAQVHALQTERQFSTYYHAMTGAGKGTIDDPLGILPTHLYLKTIGVQIRDSRSVWAGGYMPEQRSITVTQFGVRVTRESQGTTVHFPSGYEMRVDAQWQLIEDPIAPVSKALIAPAARPLVPTPRALPPSDNTDSERSVGGSMPESGPADPVDDGRRNAPAPKPTKTGTPQMIPVEMEPTTTFEVPVTTPDRKPTVPPPNEELPKTYRIKVRRR